jgi:zinc protease
MCNPGLFTLAISLSLGVSVARAEGVEGSAVQPNSDSDKIVVEGGLLAGLGEVLPPGPDGAVEHLETTLDNGLQVLVLKEPTPGIVAVQTWISVGSGGENRPGSTGYAHFFEHLMFHGTPALSTEAREARLVALGVEENAWTSQDETCYHLLGPVEHLEELLRIEADRFANLGLTEAGVRREAGAVYGEFRKSEADPFDALSKRLWSTAFTVHPYKHDTLGLEADIKAMPEGLERALAFRAAHYRPDQALVVVTGDVDSKSAMAQVQAAFGDWSAAGAAPGPVPVEPPQRRARRAHIDWKGPPIDPKLAVGWRVPGFKPGDGTSASLDVVRELLMSRASKLVRTLIDEDELVFEVYSGAPDRVAPGLLFMFLDLQPEADPEAVIAVVDAALEDLSQVREKRVRLARGRLQRKRTIALSGPEAMGQAIGRAALHGGGFKAYGAHTAAIGAVDAAAVRAVIGTLLTENRRTVVSLSSGGAK